MRKGQKEEEREREKWCGESWCNGFIYRQKLDCKLPKWPWNYFICTIINFEGFTILSPLRNFVPEIWLQKSSEQEGVFLSHLRLQLPSCLFNSPLHLQDESLGDEIPWLLSRESCLVVPHTSCPPERVSLSTWRLVMGQGRTSLTWTRGTRCDSPTGKEIGQDDRWVVQLALVSRRN